MDASAKQICGQLRGMCLPGSIQHMGIVSTLGTWPGGCRADGTVDRRSPGRETTLQRGAVRYKGKRLSSGLKSGAAVLPPPSCLYTRSGHRRTRGRLVTAPRGEQPTRVLTAGRVKCTGFVGPKPGT